MFAIIAILLPSFLGMKLMDYLLNGLKLKDLILYYGILVLLTQSINNVLVKYYYNLDDNLWNSLNIGTDFFSIYILVSIVINILLVLILVVLIKNIKFEVEVEEYAGKSKNNETSITKNKHVFIKKDSKNSKELFAKIKRPFKKNKNK